MAVVSYPYPAQGCSQAGPIPTTRPRHYVATSPSTIADVDGAASPGSTASVNGAFYVKDDGGNWDAITGGGSGLGAGVAKVRRDPLHGLRPGRYHGLKSTARHAKH